MTSFLDIYKGVKGIFNVLTNSRMDDQIKLRKRKVEFNKRSRAEVQYYIQPQSTHICDLTGLCYRRFRLYFILNLDEYLIKPREIFVFIHPFSDKIYLFL